MKYDLVVIGGGIVGLATAMRVLEQKSNTRLVVLEKEESIAQHQTGHNSGVMHSGLYYKPGSLKATNCVTGYNMLLDFSRKNEIPFELCGKMVVATNAKESAMLQTLYERGTNNGLKDLKFVGGEHINEYEPHVSGVKALWVPQTGIIDYKAVSQKIKDRILELGGEFVFGARVTSISLLGSVSTVVSTKGAYETDLVVNCGGLYSDKLTQFTEEGEIDVRIIPFRGEYYELKPEKQYLVKNLIYPVPDPTFPFLGVHFTRMIGGGVEAGPNAVFAFRREGYRRIDFNWRELRDSLAWPGFRKVAGKYWQMGLGEYYRSFSKLAFTDALQKLIPEIQAGDLVQGGAGVRAQACDRNGILLDDFAILENRQAINVLNAPSPAATSSLSIGDVVSKLALKRIL